MTGSLSAGTYVRNLRHVSRRDVRLAGGKAATLGELIQADFPVPDGFVLTTAAFERFLSRNAFAADSSPQSVAMGHRPDDVAGALRKAVADLGNVPLVVRSSGVAEDLPGASFAGQYVTILDVHGFDAVAHAARQCWASACSERVVAYRAAHSQHGVAAMAILVQRLVRADKAGSYIKLWHAAWKPELIAHLGRLQRIDRVALSASIASPCQMRLWRSTWTGLLPFLGTAWISTPV